MKPDLELMEEKTEQVETVLVLRNCAADLTSHNGFRWPAKGPVECSDWNPKPVCGGGLHGLPWGRGDWSLLSSAHDAIWQVVEVEAASIVKIDEAKVKFPKGNVIFSGPMAQAVTMVLCHPDAIKGADQISSGNYSTAASSGNYSTAASSGYGSTAASSGNYSTAASSGNYSTAASSGYGSKAASSGDGSTAASSGYGSTAASSGYGSTAASSGYGSKVKAEGSDTIAMAAGLNCIVQAGENGCFAAAWVDKKSNRIRIKVGYEGEDGIKADTPYRLNENGEWAEA